MTSVRATWSRLSRRGRRRLVGAAGVVAAVGLIGAGAATVGGDDGGDAGGGRGSATPSRSTSTVASRRAAAASATTTTTTLTATTTTAATTTTTLTATTTTAATTTTTQPVSGFIAPLTGLRVADAGLINRPALAVKIDNLDTPGETALPQAGLSRADIVFEEIVEGNITRLVTVFHSRQPGRVGPVRSARTTDIAILPQFGRPLLAWSGGNLGVVGAVRSSPSIIDVGFDRAPRSYARDRSRRAPHNLYVQADELWGRAGPGLPAPLPMFNYRSPGEPNPPGAGPASGVDIVWGGGASASVSWRWDPNLRLYTRDQRGRAHVDADSTPISATNVVVMVTPYGQSPADRRSPEALTVGNGEAFAYTNGRVIHGRWDRPDVNRPAGLTDDTGQPIRLRPGPTWIELPRAGNAHTVA